jgi:hypothetical protein
MILKDEVEVPIILIEGPIIQIDEPQILIYIDSMYSIEKTRQH